MLTFEPALETDVAALFLLNRQLIEDFEDLESIDYSQVLSWVQKNIEKHISSFTRVFCHGELAGYYCLTPSDGRMELDSLFVLPPFRNRGIGTEILRKCQAESSALFLYVFRKNVRAIALYQRMGFHITKEVGKTRYIMEYHTSS